jgi:RND superfamily putative drug exporter
VSFRFASFSSWSQRHHWAALVLWVVALAGITVASNAVGSDYHDDQSLPGTESQRVSDALAADSGAPERDSLQVVVYDGQGLRAPTVHDRVSEMLGEVAALDGVGQVSDPYRHPGAISEDGTTGYATVTLSTAPGDTDPENVRTVIETAQAARGDGLRVELGGDAVRAATESGGASEGIGMVAALLILVPMFGSVVAAGLPVLTAIFAVGSAVGLIALVSHWAMVPTYAAPMMMLVGLGVGIDYALLIFSRYRGEVLCGRPRADAVRRALDTAGRSVLFAGGTVVISLLGMLLMGVKFVQGLSVSAAATVAVTVLASLTLLPALLGFAGEKVERTRLRGLLASGFIALALVGAGLRVPALSMVGGLLAVVTLIAGIWATPLKREVHPSRPKPLRETLAYRWSRMIQHRPWRAAILGTVALLVLAAPVLGLRLGFSDESNFEQSTSTKQAYDLLVDGFGPGFNGPILLVAKLPAGATLESLAPVAKAVAADPGVAFVSPAVPDDPAKPTAVLWNVAPTTGPQDEKTTERPAVAAARPAATRLS